jgi:hypothetical protein
MTKVSLSAAENALSSREGATQAAGSQICDQVRRSRRIVIRLPGRILWQDDGTDHEEAVFTVSINRFGCALRCASFFQPGTRLRFELFGKSIEGRVVQSLKDHSVKRVTVGVSFDQDAGELWPVGIEL